MATKKMTKGATMAKQARPKARTARAARPAKKKVAAVPAGYHTATPYLIVRGAARAMDFYTRAFGAKEKVRMGMPDGTVMHAEMKIGDSMMMLADENPQWGTKAPATLGGSAAHVMLYVKDVDALVARATAAGATVKQPLSDMFWGDRYGKIADPFGHEWSVATHIEDVGPKEMRRRSIAAAKQMAGGG